MSTTTTTFWERLSINSCKLLVGSWVFIILFFFVVWTTEPGRDCPCYQVRVHLGTNLWAMCVVFLPVLYCLRLCTSFSNAFFFCFFVFSFVSPFCHPVLYRGHEELESARGQRCLRDKISSRSRFPIPLSNAGPPPAALSRNRAIQQVALHDRAAGISFWKKKQQHRNRQILLGCCCCCFSS